MKCVIFNIWYLICCSYYFKNSFLSSIRKKIENIGKMTQMTQEEIITNTKTVIQGLEALKNEHNSILNGLLTSLKAVQQEKPNDTNVVEEKTTIIKKTLESIELGLGEAQVNMSFSIF